MSYCTLQKAKKEYISIIVTAATAEVHRMITSVELSIICVDSSTQDQSIHLHGDGLLLVEAYFISLMIKTNAPTASHAIARVLLMERVDNGKTWP